jgi:hypothetical protein
MRSIFFLVIFCLSAFANSSEDLSSPQGATRLRQQGQLFTVQLVIGEPLRFYVVGKEEAKVDFEALKMTVRRLKPYPGKILTLDFKDGYFFAAESPELKDATTLEVTAKSKTNVDKVQFSIENAKP